MKRRLLLAAAALLTLAACDDNPAPIGTQVGPHPVLPEPQNYLLPPTKVPKEVGWQPGQKPVGAAGLKVEAMANGFEHPRMVYALPNGDVLVVESNSPGTVAFRPKDFLQGKVKARAGSAAAGGNRIVLLRDSNGDGKAELRTVFIDRLHSPFGVVLVGDTLYVANTDAIVAFPYRSGETRVAGPGKTLADLPAGDIDHHWTKSLTASPDGSKLYVGVGSNSNVGENGIDVEQGRAAVYEVDRATGAKRIYASGTRNPTGLAFEPHTHALYAIVQERDEIGPDLVPDYLTALKDGAFYGWPYSYYGQHVDIRAQPQRPELVAKAIPPDYALGSHVSALGIAFTAASSLPARYRGGVFIAEHGSWDRAPLSGYRVVYIPFRNGRPDGKPQDIVTGFLAPDEKTVYGRPVGLALDKTGALLIADDTGNTVWRVRAAGTTTAAR